MNEIKEIELSDGSTIFVEMEEAELPELAGRESDYDLPEGAELTSAASDRIIDAMETLKSTLSGVFNTIHEGIKDKAPDEWGVEINIGFKGKVNPIPVIVGGESNVAVKVHAKWVKPRQP
ncbi:MAG: hypothetical protein GY862_13950 [Gammaproteobacteria bacterium]|nr:hypothetical protein [Gammaproteobacteria bacterium]